MSDTRVTTVLILAEPTIGRQWEETLRGPDTRIWLGREAIPEGEHPEIILTNSHTPPPGVPGIRRVPGAPPREDVGVIQVGGQGPADVRLSEHASAEELQLACRLLGEVIWLRRCQRQASETHRELARAALTDPLTGLANRRAWDQELAQRLAEAAGGRQLCLAVLDLDQFKEINDTQGHATGDRVLQAVSRSLQRHLRHEDFVARLGGDEFGLLLWIPGEEEAAAIVERVRSHVCEAWGDSSHVTASAGFALSYGEQAADAAESLFLAADTALIAAKRAGRNRTSSPTAP